MSEKEQILDELKRVFEGEANHGTALIEILKEISAEKASERISAQNHSIWELVSHVAAWLKVHTRRLEGIETDEPEEGDFPMLQDFSEESWQKTLSVLEISHKKLMERIAELPEEKLAEQAVGRNYTNSFMLQSSIRHIVYHTGQIVLLAKM